MIHSHFVALHHPEKPIALRKIYLPLSIICLVATFLMLPVVKAGNNKAFSASKPEKEILVKEINEEEDKLSAEARAASLYENMELEKIGLTKDALVYAMKGYEKLLEAGKIKKSSVLTVIDFSQRSDKKRMYIIDVEKEEVLINTYVSHGKNTGLKYAEKFSNIHESLQSSLGFYVTKGTYHGKHGLSLRLGGMEEKFNDNAESRAIVVHGATYIGAHRLKAAYMGRSFGCPAVPKEISAKVINLIKDGTCMFIYHPSNNYLKGSKLLNG